jgi:hypothetical protein
MHALRLRWEPDVETWTYDDAEVGVFGEPFVLGADRMMTALRAAQVGMSLEPFRIVFSAAPFPGAVSVRRLEEEEGGVWYEGDLGGQVLRGWLCGHLFDYFATAPEVVYVKAEALD